MNNSPAGSYLPFRTKAMISTAMRRTLQFSIGLFSPGTLALLLAVAPARAQTWSGGSGNWSPCPPSGNALWDTCNASPPSFPNGATTNVTIDGGPVTGTGALVQNLTIGSGGSLVLTPGYLEVDGTSILNNGSIEIGAGNGLQIEGTTTTTLSGAGSVTMRANSFFTGGNGNSTLPALIIRQPIRGQGTLGDGGLAITNQNTIKVSGGELFIHPNSAGMTNRGLIQVQSGASLDLISGPYNNAGGTIQALNGSSILLEANISGGTITTSGTGNFTLTRPGAGAGLTNETNEGTFNIPAGANLNWQGTIHNTGVFNFDGSISTNGTVTLEGGGTVLVNGGQFNGLSVNPLINQQLIHGGGNFYQVPLTNQNTISADVASTPLEINGSSTNNSGTLEASGGGTLELNTVVNNSGGVIQALGGSTVIFTNNFNGSINGGTLSTIGTGAIESENGVLDGTVKVPTNAGNLQVHDFDLFFQGTINNTGTITLSGNGCIVMNAPSSLTGSGKLSMVSSTCIYGAGLAFANDSTIEGAGSIGDSNPMPITNSGTIYANLNSPLLIVPDSTGFTNTGKLMARAGSTLHINGLFNNVSSAGTLIGGTYSLNGVLEIQPSITTNAANITLIGTKGEILSDNTGRNALGTLSTNTNAGVLTFENGQSLATATSLTNAGKITVTTSSTLNVGGSYTQTGGSTTVDGTLTASGGLAISGGIVQGRGMLAAAVTSSATVIAGDSTTKAGKLTLAGTYTQKSTGVLDIAIGGTSVGSQYSQLTVSNGARLGGTLNITRTGGFTPAIGDLFTILTGSAVTGQFATVNGVNINSSEHFEVSYGATGVTLTVVTGP